MKRLLPLLPVLFLSFACTDSTPKAGQGILVGEVTGTSAFIQVRLTKTDQLEDRDVPGTTGTVTFSVAEKGSDKVIASREVEATAALDFIARAEIDQLKAGTHYLCSTQINGKEGPSATFRTLPGAQSPDPIKFVVVTGMNYAKFHGDNRIDLEQHKLENNTELPPSYEGPDKHLGYPALAAILEEKPDYFVGTGDNVYYDTPDNPRAETIPDLRQKWHEQFVQPRYRDLFAAVPTYWMVDDHDYRIDDGDNTGDYLPTPAQAHQLMIEQLPIAAHGDLEAKTYRTHRINRDLQIWIPENRIHRSPNAMEDGPEKTIWGAEQKAWLKETLANSDAKFKILLSPTPMIGPDDMRKTDNHTNHGGFRHERDEFFAWLKETGLDEKHFYIVCGDRHWQYHAIDSTGIEEFSCGALLDANSRLGRKAGDPESTDPDGLIQQPYLQDPRSGGYLSFEVADEKLTFTWHDEHGEELHVNSRE